MRSEPVFLTALLVISAVSGSALERTGRKVRLPAMEGVPSVAKLAAGGFSLRKVMADKTWFDLLQHTADYGYLKDDCRTAYDLSRTGTDFDPHFLQIYSFGSGLLMWQCGEPRLALNLLAKGIRWNPSCTRFRLYHAAFMYHEGGRLSEEIGVLEKLAFAPGAPFMVRRILANLHFKQGNGRRAAAICMLVLGTSGDQAERRWAASLLERLGR